MNVLASKYSLPLSFISRKTTGNRFSISKSLLSTISFRSGSLSPPEMKNDSGWLATLSFGVVAEHRADGRHAAEHVAGVEPDVEGHLPAVAHAVRHHARLVDRVLAHDRLHVLHHQFRLARHPAVGVAGLRPHHDEVVVLAELAERLGHLLAVLAALPAPGGTRRSARATCSAS